MKIDKIDIRNYKSCDKTLLDINDSLTVLIGVNGSGKTSILSSIRLLKKIITERNNYHFDSSNISNSLFETNLYVDFRNNDTLIQLKADFFYDIGSETEEEIAYIKTSWKIPDFKLKKWIEIPIDLLNPNIHFNIDHAINRRRLFRNKEIEKFLNIREQIPPDFYNNIAFVIEYVNSICYYSATQFSNNQKSPTSVDFEERDTKYSYRPYRQYGPHTTFIQDLIRLYREDKIKYERYLNLIGPNGLSLIDNISFEEVKFSSEEVKVKSGGKIITDTRKKLIVVPKIFFGNKILSFNQLSEGTYKTIALLFYVLQSDNSLLLIEEPEVCVHHGLLKSIIEIIKNESKNKQIVISTHSDFVLDQLQPENLVIVTRIDEEGTKSKKLTKGMTKNNYKALHEYLKTVGNLGEYWKEGGFDA